MSHIARSRNTALFLAGALLSMTAAAVAHPGPTQSAVPNASFGAYAGTFYSAGTTGLLSNVTNGTNTTSTSATFVNVSGMATKIIVPTGKKALIVSRFSA